MNLKVRWKPYLRDTICISWVGARLISQSVCYLMGEATCHNRIACKLAHVAAGKLPNLENTYNHSLQISLQNVHFTCAAILYSSIRGSLVKWNCRGSSVEIEMFRPLEIV